MPLKDPEARKAYHHKWRKQNPEKWAEYHKSWRTKYPENHKDNYRLVPIEKKIYYAIKSKCKSRGIEFDLDFEDIVFPDVCPVLGLPLDRRDSNHTPSVDRVDPTKGYTKNNIAIISLRANRMKQDATKEELEKIIAYIDNCNKNTPTL